MLKKLGENDKRRKSVQIHLWVVEGVYLHNLSLKRLLRVAKNN